MPQLRVSTDRNDQELSNGHNHSLRAASHDAKHMMRSIQPAQNTKAMLNKTVRAGLRRAIGSNKAKKHNNRCNLTRTDSWAWNSFHWTAWSCVNILHSLSSPLATFLLILYSPFFPLTDLSSIVNSSFFPCAMLSFILHSPFSAKSTCVLILHFHSQVREIALWTRSALVIITTDHAVFHSALAILSWEKGNLYFILQLPF